MSTLLPDSDRSGHPGTAPDASHVLDGMVRTLASEAGIRPPQVLAMPGEGVVARLERRAAGDVLVVDASSLPALGDRGVRALLAHEIAHLRNRDGCVGAAAAWVRSWMGWIALAGLTAAAAGRRRGRVGATVAGLVLALLAAGMAAPFCAAARARERRADDIAAELTADPEGLALAIEWAERQGGADLGSETAPCELARFASLFDWLSTHPSAADRACRLRARSGPPAAT